MRMRVAIALPLLSQGCSLLSSKPFVLPALPRLMMAGSFKGFGTASATLTRPAEGHAANATSNGLQILRYPHPKLRAENALVTEFDDELAKTVRDMFEVMYVSDGMGLAAPQVGINRRLMVFNTEADRDQKEFEMALVNPTIVEVSPELVLDDESCLSFGSVNGRVRRHVWVEVEYQSLTGEKLRTRFEDLSAVVFQHEYDHLNKVLFIDRIISRDLKRVQSQLKKMIAQFGPGGAP